MTRRKGSIRDSVARAGMTPLVVQALRSVLDTMDEREAAIVSLLFGFTDGRSWTPDEIGFLYGVTEHRIEQILGKAISRLRHPSRSVRLQYMVDDDGFPAAVLALLRNATTSRPLVRCPRHGWFDPDAVPPANRWQGTKLPQFCAMCPCPLPSKMGRPARHCDDTCRQAAHRFHRKHPRLAMTPAMTATAARLRAEGGSIDLIALSFNVSESTLRKYLRESEASRPSG